MALLGALCAFFVALLLAGEASGRRAVICFAKPLASTTFVIAAALLVHERPSLLTRAMLIAMLLSFCGDVLLIVTAKRAFLTGIAAFLLAHVAFIVAFVQLPLDRGSLVVAAALLGAIGFGIFLWIAPHVHGGLRAAVALYVLTIVAMAASAFGTERPLLVAGASAFFLSDLFVARQRFVSRNFLNKALGLPLYYAAQFLLILAVR